MSQCSVPSRMLAARPVARALAGLALLVSAALPAGVAAKADKCTGTKQERKQKFAPRALSESQFEAAVAAYEKAVSAELAGVSAAVLRRLEREYAEHQKTGAPFRFDILVLSGGGAKGAFGAGFLEGWGTIKDPATTRPEFDVVTGVSTGALIAPFAFIGTDESYRTISDLYANPSDDWARKRGWLFFLPKHASLFNNCHLRDAVRDAAAPEAIEAVAAGAAEDRVLLVGATNLDTGSGRAFDLGTIAAKSQPAEAREKVVDALLASSAIPGAFAPVLIDGMLYADGGATSNLFLVSFPGPDGPFRKFKQRHPEAPFPSVRVWTIVNQRLVPGQQVTEPKWVPVAGHALDTLMSTSQRFALDRLQAMADSARAEFGLDIELRLVSIPESGPEPKTKAYFEKQYMVDLLKLGHAMGADPAVWKTSAPHPFAVEH